MRKQVLVALIVFTMLISNLTVYAQESNDLISDDCSQALVAIGDDMFMVNEDDLDSVVEKYSLLPPLRNITIQLMSGSQNIPTAPIRNGNKICSNGELLYHIKFMVKATLRTGGPAVNYPVIAVTNNTSIVQGMKTVRTNGSGIGYIEIDVRGTNQYNLEARCEDQRASTTGRPLTSCMYQSSFYITGYITAYEGDYSNSGKISVNGLNEKYPSDFIDAVRLNGSGKTLSGKYIMWAGNNTYKYYTPTTYSGTSPKGQQTIAVDPDFIPLNKTGSLWRRATVNISRYGNRIAEDTGGAIKQYHIDMFLGLGNAAKKGFGNSNEAVSFVKATTSN